MRRFLCLLALSVPATAAEEQIPADRVSALECQAWNAFGTSSFRGNGRTVESLTNGFLRKSYRVGNLGNSAQFGFGYLNLTAGAGEIISFAFPAQKLSAGELRVSGTLFLNKSVNPFLPVIGMGTPWASASCRILIRDR